MVSQTGGEAFGFGVARQRWPYLRGCSYMRDNWYKEKFPVIACIIQGIPSITMCKLLIGEVDADHDDGDVDVLHDAEMIL